MCVRSHLIEISDETLNTPINSRDHITHDDRYADYPDEMGRGYDQEFHKNDYKRCTWVNNGRNIEVCNVKFHAGVNNDRGSH